MRLLIVPSLFLFAIVGYGAGQKPTPSPVQRTAPTRLEAVTWPIAEDRLKSDMVVVLPLGAAAQEHGMHLPLSTDQKIADYFSTHALEGLDVVVAPSLTYHHYPAFAEYPGSTSLSLNTARDFTADVARSISRHGPRRFYVLNISDAAVGPLAETAKLLAGEGILLRYTDPRARLATSIRGLQRQPFGNHADEIETSIMLYIDPASVDLTKASREIAPESAPLRLTRREGAPGTYSPSGVWGDATLATHAKGATLVEALTLAIRTDIDDLRRTTPPVATSAAPQPGRAMTAPGRSGGGTRRPDECLPGDDRSIRALGPAFQFHWNAQDALRLSEMWSPEGDMVHPDGYIEGSAQAIRQNRANLFMRPEYRGSKHPLTIGQIRCITTDIAVADGRWELLGVSDANGHILPPAEGLCTLVLRRRGGGWAIEAYRYTMKTHSAAQPTVLKRPGFTQVR